MKYGLMWTTSGIGHKDDTGLVLAGLFDGPEPSVQPLQSILERPACLVRAAVGSVAAQPVVDRSHRAGQIVAHPHVRFAGVQRAHVHPLHGDRRGPVDPRRRQWPWRRRPGRRRVNGRRVYGRRALRRRPRAVGRRGTSAAQDEHGQR